MIITLAVAKNQMILRDNVIPKQQVLQFLPFLLYFMTEVGNLRPEGQIWPAERFCPTHGLFSKSI